jgi:hypothetical protein
MSYLWNYYKPQKKNLVCFQIHNRRLLGEKFNFIAPPPLDIGHLENCNFVKYSVTKYFFSKMGTIPQYDPYKNIVSNM